MRRGFQNVADTPDGADKIGLPVPVQSLSQSAYVDVQCALFYMMQTWPHRTHELRPCGKFRSVAPLSATTQQIPVVPNERLDRFLKPDDARN